MEGTLQGARLFPGRTLNPAPASRASSLPPTPGAVGHVPSLKVRLLLPKKLKPRCREKLYLPGVVKVHHASDNCLPVTVPGPVLRAVCVSSHPTFTATVGGGAVILYFTDEETEV